MSESDEAANSGLSRRNFLKGVGASLAAAPLLSGLTACNSTSNAAFNYRTRIVLLGTMGGLSWWPSSDRASSSSALVVGDSIYLVDAGQGSTYRLAQAFNTENMVNPDGTYRGLGSANFLMKLKALFITHLHQDHLMDYPSILMIGSGAGLAVDPANPAGSPLPLKVFGPCNRGQLQAPQLPYGGRIIKTDSEDPALRTETPGTRQMTDTIWQAFAQANNDLTLDNGYRDFTALAQVTEIGGAAAGDIPLVFAPGTFVDPNTTPCPAIDPVLIYGPDGNGVAVWATLNDHRQVYPSFAFRFDTPDGSVIFSGDTGADTNGNLQKLASVGGQADFLVHEVIDTAWVNYRFGNSPPVGSRNYVLRRHMLHSHTPIEDVGTVAESCGVRTLVLNHIVPGMIPTSHLLQAQQGFSGRLVIGEDLMQIGVV